MRTLTLSVIACGVCLLAGCEEKASETTGKSDQAKGPDANVSALSSPFEALPSQPRFQLSNLRFPSPNSFTVNWRVTSGQATGSWTLAIIPGGNSMPTSLHVNIWGDETTGEIFGELQSIGPRSGPSLESGCEMFLTAQEAEHTFKISNSVTAGSVSTTPAHQPSQDVIAQIEAERQQRQQQREQQRQQPPEPTPTAQNPPTQNPNSQATNPSSPAKQAARPTRMTRPPGLRPVPPAIPIPNGTKLMATPDYKEWFPATVVASRGDDQIQVSWDQGDRPDEFLHRAKLAIDPRVLVRLRAADRRQR